MAGPKLGLCLITSQPMAIIRRLAIRGPPTNRVTGGLEDGRTDQARMHRQEENNKTGLKEHSLLHIFVFSL